jgi:hypothetical protein
MAASGEKSYKLYSECYVIFAWNVESQSAKDMTSTINWRLYIKTVSGGFGVYSNTSPTYVYINNKGHATTHASIDMSTGTEFTLLSGTSTIAHNSDGSGSFTWDFFQIIDVLHATVTGNGVETLPAVGMSEVSAESGTLGVKQTLSVTTYIEGALHTIAYKCGSATGTVCSKSSKTSVAFTPPISLASQNTTGDTVSIVFTVTTHNADGSLDIGTSTTTITCAIPESVVPTLSIVVSDPTGYADRYGYYVQKKSKISVSITASGVYGSTIGACKTEADGKAYTQNSGTEDVVTGVIIGSGVLSVVTTITDTRGRQAQASVDIDVAAYNSPGIPELSARRANADGSSSTSGKYIRVTFDAVITSLDGQNAANYTIQYKKTTDAAYTTVQLTEYAGQYDVTDGSFLFEADKGSGYNIILIASDDFDGTPRVTVGSPAQKLFSFLWRGLGIAFGKEAELEGVLDIGFMTKFSGGIMQEVLEDGANLNDITIPNTYTGNAFGQYVNFPTVETGVNGFVLEVFAAGANGELMQRLTVRTNAAVLVLYRCYINGLWENTWTQ